MEDFTPSVLLHLHYDSDLAPRDNQSVVIILFSYRLCSGKCAASRKTVRWGYLSMDDTRTFDQNEIVKSYRLYLCHCFDKETERREVDHLYSKNGIDFSYYRLYRIHHIFHLHKRLDFDQRVQ